MNNKNNPGGITGSMCYFVRGGNPEDDVLIYMDSLGGGAGADGAAFPSHTFDDNNNHQRLGGTAVTIMIMIIMMINYGWTVPY